MLIKENRAQVRTGSGTVEVMIWYKFQLRGKTKLNEQSERRNKNKGKGQQVFITELLLISEIQKNIFGKGNNFIIKF